MIKQSETGFTLVEMSFVLVIIGLVITIVFPALKSIRQNTQNQVTQFNLDALMKSSAAYVQANGCLPCPTPKTATGQRIGRVRGDTNNYACGDCLDPEGIVPFVSLGIPMKMAKDGFGNWVTMRIDPALAVNFRVVPVEKNTGFCQANLSSSNRIKIRNKFGSENEAAIIFVSHGINGKGAFRHYSTGFNRILSVFNRNCSVLGAFEHCNSDGDNNFVNANYTTSDYETFDDQIRFLDRNSLVTYLGNVACQTVW